MDYLTCEWNKTDYNLFLNELFLVQDTKYKDFHSSLVPDKDNIIGIRMPILRNIGKNISKGNWKLFLKICGNRYYEENVIKGIVIGMAKVNYTDLLKLVYDFIPCIDNWAVCDSFCAGLKLVKKNKYEDFFTQMVKLFNSDNPWAIRTGLVTILFHYIDETHINQILSECDKVSNKEYYVKMAQAWLVSICYIKFPDITQEYLLGKTNMDVWTYNKTIQKIRESQRVSKESKDFLNTLKRKPNISLLHSD